MSAGFIVALKGAFFVLLALFVVAGIVCLLYEGAKRRYQRGWARITTNWPTEQHPSYFAPLRNFPNE